MSGFAWFVLAINYGISWILVAFSVYEIQKKSGKLAIDYESPGNIREIRELLKDLLELIPAILLGVAGVILYAVVRVTIMHSRKGLKKWREIFRRYREDIRKNKRENKNGKAKRGHGIKNSPSSKPDEVVSLEELLHEETPHHDQARS